MRTIIAGSRTITDYSILDQTIQDYNFLISLVIEGGANGVDRLGREWAIENKVKFITCEAEWEKYGKEFAGRIRNNHMSKIADQLIAIWDGKSSGTYDMIQKAVIRKLNVFVRIPDSNLIKSKGQITFLNTKIVKKGYDFGYIGR